MSDEKVLTPTVIEENPFPGEMEVVLPTTSSSSPGTVSPTTIKPKIMPTKRTAVELLSSALNTRSKKVLGNFELVGSGGFQVGKYENGVSGDVRLTPAGMTARDKAGLTTFALDGDTGDAIFKGKVQAGSVISEGSIEGGSVNINDKFIVDAEGNVTVNEGKITVQDSSNNTILDALGLVSTNSFRIITNSGSPFASYSSSDYGDISGASLSFTLARSTKALVLLAIVGSSEQVNDTLDCFGSNFLRLNDNINNELINMNYDAFLTEASGIRENIISKTYATMGGVSLSAGSHTVTLQAKIINNTNMNSIVNTFDIAIVVLGN